MSRFMNTRPGHSKLTAAFLVVLWFALLGARAATPAPRPTDSVPLVQALDSVSIPVTDMERAQAFYVGVLGFSVVADREVQGEPYEHLFGVFGVRLRSVRLRLGDEYIELLQFLAPRGRPLPIDSRSNDLWFQHVAIIVSDMSAAYSRLRAHRVAHASPAPQRLPDWNPNAGGIEAFYFRDPDGNHLEVLKFPPGKGAAKWQRKDSLFLGIDHTAIVVRDTEASLAFYRDVLGLRVAGTSDNHGIEQERLNNVFGAHLRITALRASQGPGVEFLEYLAPRDGRPMPPDSRATDGWYWQMNFTSAEVSSAAQRFTAGRLPQVSTSTVKLPSRDLGFTQGVIVRDPDGHASLIQGNSP
jgi:catechol 2,3-dioxygenase-like lactoylglutathione lyase family enzyme